MLRNKWVAVLGVGLLLALPALAGEVKKCTANTQDCLDYMANKMKNSGWVGVELDYNGEAHALVVTKVIGDSPAEKAGLKEGDQLFAVNGVEYTDENMEKLSQMKAASKPGDTVTWTIKRNGYSKELTITLARMPADLLARYIGEHMMQHATVEVADN